MKLIQLSHYFSCLSRRIITRVIQQSMPKYIIPEGGRGSVGDLRAHGHHGRHRVGQHMNFAPYSSRMGSSMQNLEGFIAAGRDGDGAGVGSGNSSEEEGGLGRRKFDNQKGIFVVIDTYCFPRNLF